MTLKVCESDPVDTAIMQVNVSLFNKAQVKQVVLKRDNWKAMHDNLVKTGKP
jgi:hypothetical protein